jgi:ABC-type Fe3+ transport system substrate-binding protein
VNAPRALLAALLLAGSFPSSAPAQDVDWAKTVEQAKHEGKVVVYNSALGAPYYLAVIKAFEQKYGIQVETLDLRASEMTERIRAEQAAGRFLGDIEQHSTSTIERQIRTSGAVEPHGEIPNVKYLRPPFVATEMYVPAWVQALGMLVNTKLVATQDQPRSWTDLLDPKWKGKILSDDPRALGGGATLFAVTAKVYGIDFEKRLAAQMPVFSRDMRNDAMRVARGEYPLYITQIYALAGGLKGLPVKVIVPSDGSPYVQINNAMLRNAPHPKAARVFINYFLELEPQLAYANGGMIPVIQAALDRAGPDARPLVHTKLMGSPLWNEQEPMMALAREIYK